MRPTLLTGDRVVVVETPRARSHIHRGEVIIFRRVPADPQATDIDLVKRVVGLPGETISSRGDTIYIDDKPLKARWLPRLKGVYAEPGHQSCFEHALDLPKTFIAPGHYFVLGDCEAISYDSRYWGTVPASYIVGEVSEILARRGHWLATPIRLSTSLAT